ncbi:calcium-binding protein [Nocardioides baekrokdamisoli]|uniref:Calcium-binding protein n=1 Tax=Nocardioides baekrokdamisoli TaxID=1804624 RepID=A0A3G9IN61_9ACTN|nr:SMP-30/gluconolactonase/LRE family protein [Nocardioides baekrokdamisoli]BBH17465.1 calcium-binding protein [Nocardioides baekrokdamisoli]
MSGDLTITTVVRSHARVGEGPVWREGQLHWVDILGGQVHVSDLEAGATSTSTVPTWVGAAVPMAGGGHVAATREGFATIVDGVLDTVSGFLPEGIRMNDAKCDPTGRFWAGSCAEDFAPGAGALHCLEADWTHRTVLDGLTQPNGIGWSPDASTMYLIDTQDLALYAYAFTAADGSVGGRRVVARFDVERDGYPDGLAVDADGAVWIAMWGGGAVIRVSPTGEVLRRVAMPVLQTSSCAFVGPDLSELCVTSASEGLEIGEDSLDGSVFVVAGLGVRGTPVATFAGTRS